MKNLSVLLLCLLIIFAAACEESDSSKTTISDPFNSASITGDAVTVTARSVSFVMIYANSESSITYPTDLDDTGTASLTQKFFMAETEVTNALMAAVLQWAFSQGKFSTNVSDPNGLDSTTVKYGNQELVYLDGSQCRINYSGGSFSVDSGYENHPANNVNWYGAVMFCNWLTEMKDGNISNAVYVWTDNGDNGGTASDGIWQHGETDEDASKTGYRLPLTNEWEYAARYIGKTAPAAENLASEYVAQSYNGGSASLTAGYYWTPGDYASGAIKDYTDAVETGTVAWYSANAASADQVVGTAGTGGTTPKSGNANALGIYDMSGNAEEWCSNLSTSSRSIRGGNFYNPATSMRIGLNTTSINPEDTYGELGFRLAKTQ